MAGFLDSVIIPGKTSEPTPVGSGDGGFLASVKMPANPAQAEKLQTAQAQANASRAEATKAGSFTGIVKGTLSDLYSKIFKPSEKPSVPQYFEDPQQSLGKGVDVFTSAIQDAGDRLNSAVETAKNDHATALDKGVAIGEAGMGAINALFAPVSAVMTAGSKVPVVGYAFDVVNNIFGALGQGGSDIAKAGVDQLPISQEAKDKVKPLVGEIGALAAQIIAGKAGADIFDKITEKSKTLLTDVKDHVTENLSNPSEAPKSGSFLDQVQEPTKPTEVVPKTTEAPIVPTPAPEITVKPVETPAVAPTEVPLKQVVPGEMAPLAREALKYKTADEFVNAQEKMFRASNEPFDKSLIKDSGYTPGAYFANTKEFAIEYSNGGKRIVEGFGIEPGAKILKYEDLPTELQKNPILSTNTKNESANIYKYAKENGYDAVISENAKYAGKGKEEITVINPQIIKTRTELVDIYNKAHETAPVVQEPVKPRAGALKPVVGTGEVKTRGLAAGIEATAVEKHLADTFGELPEYRTVDLKDQAQRAQAIIEDDYQKAKDIAMGRKAPPKGVLPESVLVAVENKALAEGDVATLRDLATNSALTYEATTMGQRIRTLGERDPESPIAAIQAIKDARESALKSKIDLKKETSSEVGSMKEEIKKEVTKHQAWEDFINEIKCNG